MGPGSNPSALAPVFFTPLGTGANAHPIPIIRDRAVVCRPSVSPKIALADVMTVSGPVVGETVIQYNPGNVLLLFPSNIHRKTWLHARPVC